MKRCILALFVCLLSVFAFAEQENMSMEELLPADLSAFVRTDTIAAASGAFDYFLSLLDSGNIIVKSASNFYAASGINAADKASLKQAGIDISRPAGLGLKISGEYKAMFIMLPVRSSLLFSKMFVSALQKTDKKKRDLYPAFSRYRDFQIGQIEKDIFFFSMSGYFFVCSASDMVCSIIDTYLNRSGSLATDGSYLEYIKQNKKNGFPETLSLYAAKSGVIFLLKPKEEADVKQANKIGFLSALLNLRRGRLSFKVGMSFDSADAKEMLKVFRPDASLRIPYSKDGSYFFFSLEPKLMAKNRSVPVFGKLYAKAEKFLKEQYGLNLVHDLLPYFQGVVSRTLIKLSESNNRTQEMLYIGLNNSSEADFLKQKTSAFLKNRYGVENLDDSLTDGLSAGGKKIKHYAYWNDRGMYFGYDENFIRKLSEEPFRKVSEEEWLTPQSWGAVCLRDNSLLMEILGIKDYEKESSTLFCIANAFQSLYLAAGREDSFLYAEGYAALK